MEFMFMPLKRYAEFSGRSRRSEFWMWLLFQFVIGFVFVAILMTAAGSAVLSRDPSQLIAAGGILLVLYGLWLLMGLAFLIPNLAVTVRRLHDSGKSGWWVMLYWGPILVMLVLPRTGAGMGNGGVGEAAGLAAIVPLAWLAGCITLLVFMFLDGTRGPNQYGPDPKGGADAQAFA